MPIVDARTNPIQQGFVEYDDAYAKCLSRQALHTHTHV